jgi:hypothetical protein
MVLFGNHDYVMRIFPLFSGILTVLVVYYFSRKHFGIWGLLPLSLVSFSQHFIYYSSEMKQYSSDITVAAALLFFAGNCLVEDADEKDYLWLAIAGAMAIWISHPSVFTLAGIGLTLVGVRLFSKKISITWKWIFIIGFSWIFSFGIEYLVSLRHIIADGYLVEYWGKAYVPSPPWSNKAWYIRTYLYFLSISYLMPNTFMLYFSLALVSLAVIGALIKRPEFLALLALPFVFAYLASALHFYPLKDRFLLFLVPPFYFLLTEGVKTLFRALSKLNKHMAMAVSVILGGWLIVQGLSGTYQGVFVQQKVNIRPVLEYVSEHKAPDDVVYVFYRTRTVFRYYAPFYGLDSGRVRIGADESRKMVAIENYIDDVEELSKENRVWFIFTEVADCPACEPENTQSYFLGFIDERGVLLESVGGARSNGANAYLYGFSP